MSFDASVAVSYISMVGVADLFISWFIPRLLISSWDLFVCWDRIARTESSRKLVLQRYGIRKGFTNNEVGWVLDSSSWGWFGFGFHTYFSSESSLRITPRCCIA